MKDYDNSVQANELTRDYYRALKASAVHDFKDPNGYIIAEMLLLIAKLLVMPDDRLEMIKKVTRMHQNIVKAENI
jgi:hypothetical protein